MLYARLLGLKPYGIAFHVGSQMHDPDAWVIAIAESAELMRQLKMRGITISMLDIGGGFPAHYEDGAATLEVFAKTIRKALGTLPYQPQLVIEPGRGLVGDAGVMVSTVIGLAERRDKKWAHLDIGAFNGMMECLETQNQLRYPLRDSRLNTATQLYHLTGPSCDSQDTILFDARLSKNLQVNDKVYIYTAGAYTTSYASRFNGFDIPTVYCV